MAAPEPKSGKKAGKAKFAERAIAISQVLPGTTTFARFSTLVHIFLRPHLFGEGSLFAQFLLPWELAESTHNLSAAAIGIYRAP